MQLSLQSQWKKPLPIRLLSQAWIYNWSPCKRAYGFLKDLGEQLAVFGEAVRYAWWESWLDSHLSGSKGFRIRNEEEDLTREQFYKRRCLSWEGPNVTGSLFKGKQHGLLSPMLINQFSHFFVLVWNKTYWSLQLELLWHLLTRGRRYEKMVVHGSYREL